MTSYLSMGHSRRTGNRSIRGHNIVMTTIAAQEEGFLHTTETETETATVEGFTGGAAEDPGVVCKAEGVGEVGMEEAVAAMRVEEGEEVVIRSTGALTTWVTGSIMAMDTQITTAQGMDTGVRGKMDCIMLTDLHFSFVE